MVILAWLFLTRFLKTSHSHELIEKDIYLGLLLFRTEEKTYSQIIQSTKNVTK